MSNNIILDDSILKGLLLLILAVGGNFTGETLSCKVQNLFRKNILAKNLLTFFLLYFSITIFRNNYSPLTNLMFAFLTYILYIIINKGIFILTIVNYTLIAFYFFFIYTYKHYQDEKKKDHPLYKFFTKYKEKINTFLNYFFLVFTFLLLFSFYKYFLIKRKEYSKNWNTLIFIFGKEACKSMSK